MKLRTKILAGLGIVIGIVCVIYAISLLTTRPSNDREWISDMRELSRATIDGTTVTIDKVRNATYRTPIDFDVAYYTGTYDVSKLSKVYLLTDPFGALAAHTMLSFEFSDGKRVAMSIEVRKEIGEVFENLPALFRGYELYVVWADEKDLIKLRTNYRLDNVHMYELDMAPENMQKLFLEAVTRSNSLADNPEFYNLIVNNCTTNIAKLLQIVYDTPIVVDWRYLVPAYAEGLYMKYGFIKGNTIDEVRTVHNISAAALECGDCADYSGAIR
jgi:hypothetical protein